MNIFFLHLDVKTCAQYYFNKHCIKIILEIAQMLYTAHWMSDSLNWTETHKSDIQCDPYRKTHFNHPTCKWVRQCQNNYIYACKLGLALCNEYTVRYNKVHKSQVRLEWLYSHPPSSYTLQPINAYLATKNIPIGCTPIPLAMPVEYHCDDVLLAYKKYYLIGKAHIPDKKDLDRLRRFKIDNNFLDEVVEKI